MDKRDLALDKATHQDVFAVTDRPRHGEYLATLRMRPPATPNWSASDDRSKGRNGPLRGLEHDTVLTNEGECLA
jgi:hypothetical protein